MSHNTIQPNHAHEHLEGDSPAPSGGPSVGKSVMIPPVTGLVIGILFVTVFLAAFHAPQLHNLPVGIVGAAQQVEAVEHALQAIHRGKRPRYRRHPGGHLRWGRPTLPCHPHDPLTALIECPRVCSPKFPT